MERRPCSPFQTQPWPTSRSTSPLTIPSPRPHTLNPCVNTEWQKLRFDNRQGTGPQFRYTPRGMSRPHTPPSLSPSPSPSTSSYYTDHRDDDDLEIEELAEDSDSGIELLVGEYEEAPENYRKEFMYDSDDEDIAASHRSILYDLERLSARNRSPSPMIGFKNIMQQRLHREGAFAIPIRKSKRSYAESSGSVASSWGDSGVDSEEEGRRVRRRVVRRGIVADDCVSIHSFDGGSNNSSDNEIDMEL